MKTRWQKPCVFLLGLACSVLVIISLNLDNTVFKDKKSPFVHSEQRIQEISHARLSNELPEFVTYGLSIFALVAPIVLCTSALETVGVGFYLAGLIGLFNFLSALVSNVERPSSGEIIRTGLLPYFLLFVATSGWFALSIWAYNIRHPSPPRRDRRPVNKKS